MSCHLLEQSLTMTMVLKIIIDIYQKYTAGIDHIRYVQYITLRKPNSNQYLENNDG